MTCICAFNIVRLLWWISSPLYRPPLSLSFSFLSLFFFYLFVVCICFLTLNLAQKSDPRLCDFIQPQSFSSPLGDTTRTCFFFLSQEEVFEEPGSGCSPYPAASGWSWHTAVWWQMNWRGEKEGMTPLFCPAVSRLEDDCSSLWTAKKTCFIWSAIRIFWLTIKTSILERGVYEDTTIHSWKLNNNGWWQIESSVSVIAALLEPVFTYNFLI